MQQFPTIVNLHGAAAGTDDAREHLLSRSIAFFTWAGQWCRDNAPQVGVTVELQISPDPGEPGSGSATPTPSCWTSRRKATSAPAGISATPTGTRGASAGRSRRPRLCSSESCTSTATTPPPRTISRWCTARCRGGSSSSFCVDHGFDGRVILEVPPDQFLRAGGIQSLIDSAKALKSRPCRVVAKTSRRLTPKRPCIPPMQHGLPGIGTTPSTNQRLYRRIWILRERCGYECEKTVSGRWDGGSGSGGGRGPAGCPGRTGEGCGNGKCRLDGRGRAADR